jgi:hypothetical protein
VEARDGGRAFVAERVDAERAARRAHVRDRPARTQPEGAGRRPAAPLGGARPPEVRVAAQRSRECVAIVPSLSWP